MDKKKKNFKKQKSTSPTSSTLNSAPTYILTHLSIAVILFHFPFPKNNAGIGARIVKVLQCNFNDHVGLCSLIPNLAPQWHYMQAYMQLGLFKGALAALGESEYSTEHTGAPVGLQQTKNGLILIL